jgi:hypothetical protein
LNIDCDLPRGRVADRNQYSQSKIRGKGEKVVGALAHWRVGALAHWRIGALACWRIGVLAHWRVGALACWRIGVLACWRIREWRSLGTEIVKFFPYWTVSVILANIPLLV